MTTSSVDDQVEALERALQDLQAELAAGASTADRERKSTVSGVVWEFGFPAGIAAIEAQLRTMEFVAERVRQANRRRGTQASLEEWSGEARDQTVETMDRLDTVLDRLERELRDGRLPASREASDLLAEARSLQTEIQDRVRAGEGSSGETRGRDQGVTIDVESELETIREEVDRETDGDDTGDESAS